MCRNTASNCPFGEVSLRHFYHLAQRFLRRVYNGPSGRFAVGIEPRMASGMSVDPLRHAGCIPLDSLALRPLNNGFPGNVDFFI